MSRSELNPRTLQPHPLRARRSHCSDHLASSPQNSGPAVARLRLLVKGLRLGYLTVILPPTRPAPRVALPGFYLIPRRRRVAERLSPIQLVGEVVADEAVVFAMLGDLRLVTRVPAPVS